jgi:hypothetical protein
VSGRALSPQAVTAMNWTRDWPGIVGLDAIDALDGIAAAQCEERVAAPFGPIFEAAER